MLKNAKHEHFAKLVVKGVSASKAYISAGYSENNGFQQSAARLLKNPVVAERITELRKTVEEPSSERAIEKAALNKAWVLHELMENVRMAKQAEPVRDADGNPTGEYRQNLPAANKALELLGTELGMFVNKTEVRSGPLDNVSHEELKDIDAALAELLARQGAAGSESAGTGSTRH